MDRRTSLSEYSGAIIGQMEQSQEKVKAVGPFQVASTAYTESSSLLRQQLNRKHILYSGQLSGADTM